jgi:hypothetical protein
MEKYLKPIPTNIKRIKIDVGLSYNAPQSQIWLDHDDDLFVFGFEPNEENIASLTIGNVQKRHPSHGTPISAKNMERFCLIPVALENVEVETEMVFYETEKDSGTSSLNRPIESELGAIKNTRKVPVFALKHFFDAFDWERFPFIEYLKIDAQGSDLNILKSAEHYLSDRILFVTAEAEMHTYEGISNNNQYNMDKYMSEKGFIRISHPNTSDPTYLNIRLMEHDKDVFIFQQG